MIVLVIFLPLIGRVNNSVCKMTTILLAVSQPLFYSHLFMGLFTITAATFNRLTITLLNQLKDLMQKPPYSQSVYLPVFISALLYGVLPARQAQADIVYMAPVKEHYTTVNKVEDDQQLQTRLNKIRALGKKFAINWKHPYLYTGKVKTQQQSTYRYQGKNVSIVKPLTPRQFDVVYRVNTTGQQQLQYVFINKRRARYRLFTLNAKDVTAVTTYHPPQQRILYQHIQDKKYQAQLHTFAKRLVERKICLSVRSGARYKHNSVTLFCGDGMQYNQTIKEIDADKPIQTRVVRRYAVFFHSST